MTFLVPRQRLAVAKPKLTWGIRLVDCYLPLWKVRLGYEPCSLIGVVTKGGTRGVENSTWIWVTSVQVTRRRRGLRFRPGQVTGGFCLMRAVWQVGPFYGISGRSRSFLWIKEDRDTSMPFIDRLFFRSFPWRLFTKLMFLTRCYFVS